MTRIFSVAETTDVPHWFKPTAGASDVAAPEALRIAAMPADLTDDQLVQERDVIEQCANAKTTYRYSSTWSESNRRQLLEYATVCGAKVEAVNPSDPKLQRYAARVKATNLQKTAAAAPTAPTLAEEVAALLGDPFHLDTKGDMSHMEPAKWDSVRPPTRANDVPQIALTGASVLNIGAANEASVPRQTRIAPGQNSMLQPNAIGELAESKDVNTSARLRQEAKERHDKHKDANRHRDASMVAEAEAAEKEIPGGMPRGSVFHTEARESSGSFTGGHIPDKTTMPELTAGEKLHQANIDRKAGIQRKKEETRDWDQPQGASRHMIDKNFIAAIKTQLGE